MRASALTTKDVYAYQPSKYCSPRPARLLSLAMWTTSREPVRAGERQAPRYVPSPEDTVPVRASLHSMHGDVGYLAVTSKRSGLAAEHSATVLQDLEVPSGLDPDDVTKLRAELPERLELEILSNRHLVGPFSEVCAALRIGEEKVRAQQAARKAAEDGLLGRIGRVRDRIAAHGLERHEVRPGSLATQEGVVPLSLLESLLNRLEKPAS
ncbi:hypothetical protein [Streptomyces pseudogriseolus]|uniref:hypothetical protein n=1 Tax=Streptomyces pseudogriseolus TaxID=36817 RepID=UPI003FA23F8D